MASKSSLAVALSRLKLFSKPKIKLEQHSTDSEVAAGVLWNLKMLGDLDDAVLVDLGCGTGILGIGALLLGAKKVYFVDTDRSALDIAKENIEDLDLEYDNNIEFIESDVKDLNPNMFKEEIDLAIQNPPFGTNDTHADKVFLEKAFSIANKVVSFHKESTKKFVEAIPKSYKFSITHHWRFKFPLKKTQEFHKKRIQYIDVGCWRFEKVK